MRNSVVLALLILLLLPALGSESSQQPFSPGSRVKIKGEVDGAGRLVASSLRQKNADDDDLELCGVVERVDPETRFFRVHGVWVDAQAGDLNRRQRRVAQALLPGDWVLLEGDIEGSRLVIDHLSRPRGEERVVSVEGMVTAIERDGASDRELRIGPVVVVVTDATELRGF